MSVAKTWLESCSDSGQHDCDAESKSLEMPTRLLEIDMERKRVKLVGGETALTSALTRQAGSGLTRRPYALLSYCWGGDQIVKTIRPNLEKHGKGIPIESLSRSVRDATLVAAALGLEYIWVDALCIVQDDEQEVNQEIAKMHQIFQGGYVTILAGTARSANEGFLQRRESGPRFRLPLRFPDGEQGSVILQPQIDSRSLAKLDPIFDRGWIFQESMSRAQQSTVFSAVRADRCSRSLAVSSNPVLQSTTAHHGLSQIGQSRRGICRASSPVEVAVERIAGWRQLQLPEYKVLPASGMVQSRRGLQLHEALEFQRQADGFRRGGAGVRDQAVQVIPRHLGELLPSWPLAAASALDFAMVGARAETSALL